MSLFLLCHSEDANVFFVMDDIDRVYATHGDDTREAPWRIVSTAMRKHKFVEPTEFEFRDEQDMFEYLDSVSEKYWTKVNAP